jgi:hypothetical protein
VDDPVAAPTDGGAGGDGQVDPRILPLQRDRQTPQAGSRRVADDRSIRRGEQDGLDPGAEDTCRGTRQVGVAGQADHVTVAQLGARDACRPCGRAGGWAGQAGTGTASGHRSTLADLLPASLTLSTARREICTVAPFAALMATTVQISRELSRR